jgi:hypothetical protein
MSIVILHPCAPRFVGVWKEDADARWAVRPTNYERTEGLIRGLVGALVAGWVISDAAKAVRLS